MALILPLASTAYVASAHAARRLLPSFPRSRLQHGHRIEQFAHHIEGVLALDLRLGPDDQAMAEHAGGDGLHVLMREVVPAVEQGAGAAQRSRHSDARGLAPSARSG